jgi:hypothetical protein
MEQTQDVRVTLEAVADVLWRGAVICFGLLLFWLLMYLLGGGWMFEVHRALVGIEKVDFVRMNYGGMAALKLALFVLFLIPYVSIRWHLARSR